MSILLTSIKFSIENLITEGGEVPGGEFLAGAMQVAVIVLRPTLPEELLQLALGHILHDHVGRLCEEENIIFSLMKFL